MRTRKRKGQQLIDGLRLKSIIGEQFAILGHIGLDALYYEMSRHGFNFESDRAYSVDQIESFFVAMFGADAASLMLNRIKKALAKA
jgi:hypothetical protein